MKATRYLKDNSIQFSLRFSIGHPQENEFCESANGLTASLNRCFSELKMPFTVSLQSKDFLAIGSTSGLICTCGSHYLIVISHLNHSENGCHCRARRSCSGELDWLICYLFN